MVRGNSYEDTVNHNTSHTDKCCEIRHDAKFTNTHLSPQCTGLNELSPCAAQLGTVQPVPYAQK